MSIDKTFVLTALLQHNYFPTQRRTREELPPIFTSVKFTSVVAKKVVAGKSRKAAGFQGYDAVDYKLTRFNGVSRSCSIPHPTPYADLSLCISEHWDKLDYIAKNKSSIIKPHQHSDGRLIIMDYERTFEKTKRSLHNAFGRRFVLHTDVSSCFPTIYSHAISWALVGFSHAKKYKGPKHKGEWFNQLDEKLRLLKRNETQGVPIGPATSNILSEAILARIDEALGKDFGFIRYIDDYTAYCTTEDEAREFVRRLAVELAKYKLLLNITKTRTMPLPQALTADWIAELAIALPKGKNVGGYDAVTYLNMAVEVAKSSPDGSVLKYALKSLLGRDLAFMTKFDVLRYALTLSFHQPVLLPLLANLFEATSLPGAFRYGGELQHLAFDNARFRRSDAIAWTLYYMNRYMVVIEQEVADEVIASRDCFALLMLYLSGNAHHQASVIAFVENLDGSDLYELDQYWLLLFELFRDGKIGSPYKDEDAFEIMRDHSVSFVTLPPINTGTQQVQNSEPDTGDYVL